MLKINVSFSKKVPGEEQYSSINFHGSLERELSDGLSPEQIQKVFHENYALLENTIEQEIANYSETENRSLKTQAQTSFPAHNSPQNHSTGGYSSSPTNTASGISQKQVTFLNRLGAERGLSQQQIDAMALNQFGAESIWQLSKQNASKLIEQLQNQRAA